MKHPLSPCSHPLSSQMFFFLRFFCRLSKYYMPFRFSSFSPLSPPSFALMTSLFPFTDYVPLEPKLFPLTPHPFRDSPETASNQIPSPTRNPGHLPPCLRLVTGFYSIWSKPITVRFRHSPSIAFSPKRARQKF